jgi:hypothetical protein
MSAKIIQTMGLIAIQVDPEEKDGEIHEAC